MEGAIARVAGTVATAAVGAAAYDGIKRLVRVAPWRTVAVRTSELAIRGTRHVEATAENARLTMADIVAEARERVGEEAQPPAGPADHGHGH